MKPWKTVSLVDKFFFYDNAPSHTSNIAQAKKHEELKSHWTSCIEHWEIKPICAKKIKFCSIYHVNIKHASIFFHFINLFLWFVFSQKTESKRNYFNQKKFVLAWKKIFFDLRKFFEIKKPFLWLLTEKLIEFQSENLTEIIVHCPCNTIMLLLNQTNFVSKCWLGSLTWHAKKKHKASKNLFLSIQ